MTKVRDSHFTGKISTLRMNETHNFPHFASKLSDIPTVWLRDCTVGIKAPMLCPNTTTRLNDAMPIVNRIE